MNRAFTVLLVLIMSSPAAVAQPAGAQAEVLFRQGRALMSAGKLAEACSAFEESQKLEGAVTTLLNLAGCREKLGQIASAWGLFLEAARQSRSSSNRAQRQLHQIATARARKLEPRVSRLTIQVPPQHLLDGLEIMRGAERVEAGLWNRALPIDGGSYTITARAPGTVAWSAQVTVAPENDSQVVDVPMLRPLPREQDRPSAPPPPQRTAAMTIERATAPPRAAASPRAPSKAVPLVVGASALLLLGGGLGFELWAESAYDAARAEMTRQTRRRSLEDSANTRRYVGEAFAATGLVAGGAAVWLYLRGRNGEQRIEAARVHVVPTPAGLAVSGWF